MGDRLAVLDEVRDDVLAEIARRSRRLGIAAEFVEQQFGVKDVDPHRCQRDVRVAGDRGRVGGLLDERGDVVVLVHGHNAEADRLHPRHFEAGDGDVRAGLAMLLQDQLVVHLVDVVAGQDDHVFGRVALDDVDVLVDRIGGALVPLELADPL